MPDLINIPQTAQDVDFNFTGGCFGTGPGELNVSSATGILNLHSFFLEYGSTNVFTVHVTKEDGYDRLAVFDQAVRVVDGVPPELNVE